MPLLFRLPSDYWGQWWPVPDLAIYEMLSWFPSSQHGVCLPSPGTTVADRIFPARNADKVTITKNCFSNQSSRLLSSGIWYHVVLIHTYTEDGGNKHLENISTYLQIQNIRILILNIMKTLIFIYTTVNKHNWQEMHKTGMVHPEGNYIHQQLQFFKEEFWMFLQLHSIR